MWKFILFFLGTTRIQGTLLIHNREGSHGSDFTDTSCNASMSLKIGSFFELRVQDDRPPFSCVCTISCSQDPCSPRITHFDYSSRDPVGKMLKYEISESKVFRLEVVYDPKGDRELSFGSEGSNDTAESFASMQDSFRFEIDSRKGGQLFCDKVLLVTTTEISEATTDSITIGAPMPAARMTRVQRKVLFSTVVVGIILLAITVSIGAFAYWYQNIRKKPADTTDARCVYSKNATSTNVQGDMDTLVENEAAQAEESVGNYQLEPAQGP